MVRYWLTPAENFSGDVLAAARAPSGCLYALLADAAGHGLTAAISTVPLLTLFYRLAPEGTPLTTMVGEINQHLRDAMPLGRFVGATLVCLDPVAKQGEIWVGGMPKALLLDDAGIVRQEFPSRNLPLGILDTNEIETAPQIFSWAAPSQLVLYSDGLVEAEDAAGQQFGTNRMLAALGSGPGSLDRVKADLADHLESKAAQDDVSLLILTCP